MPAIREYVKLLAGAAALPSRLWSSHCTVRKRIRSWSDCGPAPPSWPPVNQATRTGVPCAAMPFAFASASESGNSESASPCTSRVGAVIRSRIEAGLDRRSSVTCSGVAVPVVAIDRYAWQTSAAKRPQDGSVGAAGRAAAPGGPVSAAVADEPLPKNRPAHTFLKTPLPGPAPVASGRNALARSFQVICGTIASMRLS